MAFTVSCTAQWGKRIKGNGNTITTDRSVGDYDAVALSGWFDVDLVDGKEGTITLEGESNLLDYVITEVKDGKLVELELDTKQIESEMREVEIEWKQRNQENEDVKAQFDKIRSALGQ